MSPVIGGEDVGPIGKYSRLCAISISPHINLGPLTWDAMTELVMGGTSSNESSHAILLLGSGSGGPCGLSAISCPG